MPRTKVELHALLARSRKPRARRAGEDNPAVQAILDVVAQIPRGRASTYGHVASEAGLPGRARLAGRALRQMPPGMHLPWHRVVGAGGKIVFPVGSSAYREQVRRLKSEGVEVHNGRIDASALLRSSLRD